MMASPTVGYAGMTHLGIVSAAGSAARGLSTLCFDPDPVLVARLARQDPPIHEPDLVDTMAANAGMLRHTVDVADLATCDLVYIAADVPTDDQGRSDLTPIRSLVERVVPVLRDDTILVVLSQVPPGFCRSLCRLPPDRLYYQVETLVFGRAVDRAFNPERFIIGCADPDRGLPPCLSAALAAYGCPILPMRYESAELAKISINFCLVASVSVANTLAEVSEAVGADWAEIVPALKLDRRIGPHSYLMPGLGISGGNLERDLRSIIGIGTTSGTDVGVVEAWLRNSEHRKEWTWRTLRDSVLDSRPDAIIAVLGLAYKENTSSLKNSPALALLAHLGGLEVRVHDPAVPSSAVPTARWCAAPADCIAGADVLVVTTPWPQYRGLDPDALAGAMRGRTIIDPHRMIDGRRAAGAGFAYHTLGAPPRRPSDGASP